MDTEERTLLKGFRTEISHLWLPKLVNRVFQAGKSGDKRT